MEFHETKFGQESIMIIRRALTDIARELKRANDLKESELNRKRVQAAIPKEE